MGVGWVLGVVMPPREMLGKAEFHKERRGRRRNKERGKKNQRGDDEGTFCNTLGQRTPRTAYTGKPKS